MYFSWYTLHWRVLLISVYILCLFTWLQFDVLIFIHYIKHFCLQKFAIVSVTLNDTKIVSCMVIIERTCIVCACCPIHLCFFIIIQYHLNKKNQLLSVLYKICFTKINKKKKCRTLPQCWILEIIIDKRYFT